MNHSSDVIANPETPYISAITLNISRKSWTSKSCIPPVMAVKPKPLKYTTAQKFSYQTNNNKNRTQLPLRHTITCFAATHYLFLELLTR